MIWVDMRDVRNSGVCVLDCTSGGSVAVIVWVDIFILAVHVAAADKGPLAGFKADVREPLGGGNVDCGVVCCCCGAVTERGGNAVGVD